MTKQIKTKPGAQAQKPKKKAKVYSEKQLNLPVLNSIIPANAKTVQRAGGTGKKKNKVYVDDVESMTTILAIVTAEKEGHIESKVAAERQKEEVRQARLNEAEAKEKKRQGKINDKKDEIKDGKRKSKKREDGLKGKVNEEKAGKAVKKRKSVSFAS